MAELKTFLRRGGVGRMDQARLEIALIAKFALVQFFGFFVELVQFPLGGACVHPSHSGRGYGGLTARKNHAQSFEETSTATVFSAVMQP